MMTVELKVSVSHLRNLVGENLDRNTNCGLLTQDDPRRWFKDPLTTFWAFSKHKIRSDRF